MSKALVRFTTEYIETEDRLRLAGEFEEGASVVVWLTHRLVQRLLPILLQWLEQQYGDTPRAEVLQSWAQQAARADLLPQPPVAVAEAGRELLGVAVDITPTPDTLNLTFRGAGEESGEGVTLSLTAVLLRQWLNILQDGYRLAEWPLAGWPEWLRESGAAGLDAGAAVH